MTLVMIALMMLVMMYYRENLRALGSTRDLSLLERVANRPPLARPAEVYLSHNHNYHHHIHKYHWHRDNPPEHDGGLCHQNIKMNEYHRSPSHHCDQN